MNMRYSGWRRLLCLLSGLLLIAAAASASSGAILGVFQGRIVQILPASRDSRWIVVQSRNGFVRKVNITGALVEYDDDFPPTSRRKDPNESIRLAAIVRITAEQAKSSDGSGEWKAKEILIIAPIPAGGAKPGPRPVVKPRPASGTRITQNNSSKNLRGGV